MNLNAFRIFISVYEKRSMTAAAAQLNLTQSGISQHVKALEDELGFPLFERINRKIFPTSKAIELYERGHRAVEEIDRAVREATDVEETPRGTVRIGLPIEYGNNVAIPALSEMGLKYPELNFEITLDFATVLSRMVLRGELDCALIDRFKVDSSLDLEVVAEENLLLCGLKSYVKGFGPVRPSTGYFSRFNYVDYTAGEPIVRSWFRHHLNRRNIDIRVRARIFDVQGVSKFILSGLGLGVLPDYLVADLQREGVDLHVFESKRAPLKNEICMISLPLKDRPLAQKLVMQRLRELQKTPSSRR